MNWNALITCANPGAGDTNTNTPSTLGAMNVRVLDPGEVRERLELRAAA